MSELGAIQAWRLKERISFGTNDEIELPNGNSINQFVEKFHRNCADYRISPRYILSNPGMNLEETITVAIRHFGNTDFSSFVAKYKGKEYQVTHVLIDDTKIVTYDLVFLKSTEKNG